MSTKITFNEKVAKEFAEYLSQTFKIDLGDSDSQEVKELIIDTVKGTFLFIGEKLGENKSENDDVVLSIPDTIEFKCSYREGSGSSAGNWGIGITAGPEMKKRLKDDDILEDLDEGDDE